MAYFECIVGGGGGGTSLIIQISTTSESLYGQTITISKNGSTVGTTTFDNQGEAEYTVDEAGTYTVSATVSGTTYSDTVEVTDTFEASIEEGFNYHTWLVEGDVSDTYSSLNEVLADEEAVRKLMTIHDAVDYLASFTSDDASVVTILNNDFVAKWISLRDYAMDVLEAAYGTLMGTIGKYGYGEWALLPQVPTMASNTTPSGECLASSVYSGRYYWYGFRYDTEPVATNVTTFWTTEAKGAGQWLGYDFKKPVLVRKCTFRPYETNGKIVQVQGTNDISGTWYDIGEPKTLTGTQFGEETITMPNNSTEYRYYRLYMVTAASSGHATAQLQFYAYSAKGNVPIMTSNTAPYGEAIKSAEYSGASYYAWNAFAPSVIKGWDNDSTNPYIHANNYVGYAFTTPTAVKKASFLLGYYTNSTVTVEGKFQGYDGSDWVDLCDAFSFTSNAGNIPTMVTFTKNIGFYLQYRWICTTQPNGANHYGIKLQFYGRQMTVSVPTMTGNTSPYGEAFGNNSGSSASKSGDYYNPFKESPTAIYYKGGTGMADDSYIGYTFTSKVKILAVFAKAYNGWGTFAQNAIIQGSNDGTTWVDVGTGEKTFSQSGTMYFVSNPDMYSQYRLKFTNYYYSSSYNWIGVAEIRFYGLDYSERDWDTSHPRHYIYDHGLELDTFVKASYSDSSAVVEKRPSEILLQIPSPSGSKQSGIVKTIDLTDYELMRMCVGDEYVNGSYESLGVYSNSFSILVSRLRPLSNMPYNTGLDIASDDSTYEIVIETSNKLTVAEWWLE